MTEEDYKYRKSYVFIPMIFFFILSFWMFYDSFKTVDSVENATGIIVDKGVKKERYKGNNYRFTFYFRINNKDQYFGIFLGSGDNAIKEGDYYDDLIKIGEPITVYYDNNLITKSENITRVIYRLDYNGKTIIETNQNGRRIVGLVSLGIGLMFLWMRFWLKRKYLREIENEK
ncbi:MAG: hypothetical protein KBB61_06885 [Paludibacteraceae bacterium]|nr:hypothetical protein [Paludibacteraceae bacterium]